MKVENPIPEKWKHLRPQTLEVFEKRGWHDPREAKFKELAPMEKGITGPVCTSIAYILDRAEEAAGIFSGVKHGYAYPRVSLGTPPIQQLSNKLLDLELGPDNPKRHEYDVALTCSGMAAISLLILSLTESGSEFISSPYLYGGTYHLFYKTLKRWRINCHFLEGDPLCRLDWARIMSRHPKSRFVFTEDDANPTPIKLNNRAIAEQAHEHGMLYFCDRTVGTPVLEKPLLLGADGVVHSLSKNIGGSSGALGGAVIARKEIISKLLKDLEESLFVVLGPVMDPRVADYMLAGITTLEERMLRKIFSARQIVDFLKKHSSVRKVHWSGTDLLSFDLRGSLADAQKVIESFKLIYFAPHLGDDYALAIHPASTTHASVPAEKRIKLGISDTLIRLSVGLFDPQDVIDDLEQSLQSIS